MSALDSVLADLVEADRECAYVTVKREPLESLIEEWLSRGDQISILCSLLARAQQELAAAWKAPIPVLMQLNPRAQEAKLRELNCATAQLSTAIAHHRHAVRQGPGGTPETSAAVRNLGNPCARHRGLAQGRHRVGRAP